MDADPLILDILRAVGEIALKTHPYWLDLQARSSFPIHISGDGRLPVGADDINTLGESFFLFTCFETFADCDCHGNGFYDVENIRIDGRIIDGRAVIDGIAKDDLVARLLAPE